MIIFDEPDELPPAPTAADVLTLCTGVHPPERYAPQSVSWDSVTINGAALPGVVDIARAVARTRRKGQVTSAITWTIDRDSYRRLRFALGLETWALDADWCAARNARRKARREGRPFK